MVDTFDNWCALSTCTSDDQDNFWALGCHDWKFGLLKSSESGCAEKKNRITEEREAIYHYYANIEKARSRCHNSSSQEFTVLSTLISRDTKSSSILMRQISLHRCCILDEKNREGRGSVDLSNRGWQLSQCRLNLQTAAQQRFDG
jgi:hypothetical protein